MPAGTPNMVRKQQPKTEGSHLFSRWRRKLRLVEP